MALARVMGGMTVHRGTLALVRLGLAASTSEVTPTTT
jgi:hypothetical protein